MNTWTARSILVMLVTAAACGEPPVRSQTQVTPTAAPAPAAEQAPATDAIARADALLNDLKQKEAAQAKMDRERPAPAADPIPTSTPASRPTPPATTVAASSPVATDAPATRAHASNETAATPAHDEAWWKQQRQSLQLTLDAALAQLDEAEKRNFKYSYNDLQAEYKKRVAAVAEARLAIDRLHDDARRAGVPPGWLR
jgi:hypothetical protein